MKNYIERGLKNLLALMAECPNFLFFWWFTRLWFYFEWTQIKQIKIVVDKNINIYEELKYINFENATRQ